MKYLTREQAQSRKEKAVRFVTNVLADPDRAQVIADEDLQEYADRKGIEIINPGAKRITKRRQTMARATKTKAELEDEIRDLKDENSDLQDQLDAISDIVGATDDDDDADDGDEDDDDDQEDDERD
jgi:cell fate (sporulation/competence/biofilm development) regulator YlbF (YheA/YmcA/DUF963 family)